MSPTLTCLALALMGVELDYRPAANGMAEYIIHIDPNTLRSIQPGVPIEIDVPRNAREIRVSHITITGEDKLPGEVSTASALPPGPAPLGPANPLVMSGATAAVPPIDVRGGIGPVNITPSGGFPQPDGPRFGAPEISAPPKPSAAQGEPAVDQNAPGAGGSMSTSDGSRFSSLEKIPEPVNAWWVMPWLLVVALGASNVYVGWLFLETRQRYLGLLRRTFSIGQPAAEA